MLIRPVGAAFLDVDTYTDVAMLTVTFHGFVKVPRKSVGVKSEWLSLLLHVLG